MAPPNPLLQSPSQRPQPPPKTRAKSSDDIDAVRAAEDAEARARASMHLMQEEHDARVAAEKHRDELEAQLKRVAAAPVTIADAKSMHPGGHVQVAFSNKKFVIPFTVITAVAPLVWVCVQYVVGVTQQVKALNTAVSGYEKSQEAMNDRIDAVVAENALLKNTQARQAGYLAGALPMAGVSVPGAESGAIQVDISRDPDPVGTKKHPKVVTHTFVPAPPPGR